MKRDCTDFIFCNTCRMYVDFYKYDSIDDTGHLYCDWRFVTKAELKELLKNCEEEGCLDDPAEW